MPSFALHPQLLADCHVLGRLPATHLLLHRNSAAPWFILVPETDQANLLDLPTAHRDAVLADCTRVSDALRTLGYPKINVAWIGNLVPQLHIHVIGRRPGDACWPRPVWGHLVGERDYAEHEITALRAAVLG
ncbi:MAG: HIT family protein [Chromatiales bacterium]|nr:HIT family protein [Chromatiales bacterium]